ncbi:MAG: hypothetical protein ABIG28_03460 [archaeon]
MTDENKQQEKKETKKKIEAKPLPVDKEKAREIEQGLEAKVQDKPQEQPDSSPKETSTTQPQKRDSNITKDEAEAKTSLKKDKDKSKEKPIPKKEEAIARGQNLPFSKKHGMYICSFIKNKSIDKAIKDLLPVLELKTAIPFKGEIPHRKGKIMSGRYPVKATKYFINLLKALKGNIIVNGMEIEKTKIYLASTSWARRPARREGRSAKRVNIILKAKEFKENKEEEKKNE